MIVLPGRFFLFFVSRQKDEWWSEKIFPRGCLSLSRSSRQTKALPRDRNTDDDVLSLLSLSRSFRSRRRDNEACVCPRRFPRACVQIRDRWENSIPKSFALCLCPVLLSRQKDARKTSPASTRALSTVSQCPRVSPGRVFASVKRERNDPKFVRKLLLFFPRSFISPIKCSQFSQRGWRERNDDALRDPSFRTQHTPGEDDDDDEDEEERRELYERVLLSFRLKMCCLLCVMTSNKI